MGKKRGTDQEIPTAGAGSRVNGTGKPSSEMLTVLVVGIMIAGAICGYLYWQSTRDPEPEDIYRPDDDNGNGTGNDTDGTEPIPPRRAEILVLNETRGADGKQMFSKNATHILEGRDLETQFLIIIRNTGLDDLDVSVTKFVDNGGPWRVKVSAQQVHLRSGTTQPVFVNVSVNSQDQIRTHKIIIQWTDGNSTPQDSVDLVCVTTDQFGKNPDWHDTVTLDWTILHRGIDESYVEDDWSVYDSGTMTFELGDFESEGTAVVGLHMAVEDSRTLKTSVVLLEYDQAYGIDPSDGYPDGDVIFEFRVIDVVEDGDDQENDDDL